MKVALITRAIHPLHGRGGLERHTGALKRYLERAGCDVRVFTQPPRQELSELRDEKAEHQAACMGARCRRGCGGVP